MCAFDIFDMVKKQFLILLLYLTGLLFCNPANAQNADESPIEDLHILLGNSGRGIIDTTGNILIQGLVKVESYGDGFYLVEAVELGNEKNSVRYFLDTLGNFLSGPGNDVVYEVTYEIFANEGVPGFSDGMAKVESATSTSSEYIYVNTNGKEVIGHYHKGTPFINGLAAVLKEKKGWMVIDKTGKSIRTISTETEIKRVVNLGQGEFLLFLPKDQLKRLTKKGEIVDFDMPISDLKLTSDKGAVVNFGQYYNPALNFVRADFKPVLKENFKALEVLDDAILAANDNKGAAKYFDLKGDSLTLLQIAKTYSPAVYQFGTSHPERLMAYWGSGVFKIARSGTDGGYYFVNAYGKDLGIETGSLESLRFFENGRAVFKSKEFLIANSTSEGQDMGIFRSRCVKCRGQKFTYSSRSPIHNDFGSVTAYNYLDKSVCDECHGTGVPVATVEILRNMDSKERLKEDKAQKSKARQAERAKRISVIACWRCNGDGKVWRDEVIVLRGAKMVREPTRYSSEITCLVCKGTGEKTR
jgi:hypothetical protein